MKWIKVSELMPRRNSVCRRIGDTTIMTSSEFGSYIIWSPAEISEWEWLDETSDDFLSSCEYLKMQKQQYMATQETKNEAGIYAQEYEMKNGLVPPKTASFHGYLAGNQGKVDYADELMMKIIEWLQGDDEDGQVWQMYDGKGRWINKKTRQVVPTSILVCHFRQETNSF